MASPPALAAVDAVSAMMMEIIRLEVDEEIVGNSSALNHLRAAWTSLYDARKAVEDRRGAF